MDHDFTVPPLAVSWKLVVYVYAPLGSGFHVAVTTAGRGTGVPGGGGGLGLADGDRDGDALGDLLGVAEGRTVDALALGLALAEVAVTVIVGEDCVGDCEIVIRYVVGACD